MKKSFSASLFAHSALLFGALVVLPSPEQIQVQQEAAVEVDISNISDESKTKAQTKQDVPKVEQPKAEKTEVMKPVKPAPKVAEEEILAAKPKEPEPAPEPEKKPEDKPVEDTKLEELLKEQAAAEAEAAEALKVAEQQKKIEEKKKKEADAKKKAEAKKKADEEKKKKQKLDVAELEQLLNKENEERTAPKKSSDTSGSPSQSEKDVQGDDAEAKATFKDALIQRIKECFSPPAASLDGNIRIKVEVDFSLNPDGTLKGVPKPQSTGIFLADAVANAASAAIVECQPYNFFPPGKYKGFARWIIEFDPRDSRT